MQTNDMKFRLWNMVLVLALMMGSVVIAPAPVQAQEGQNRVMLPMVMGGNTFELDTSELLNIPDAAMLETMQKEISQPEVNAASSCYGTLQHNEPVSASGWSEYFYQTTTARCLDLNVKLTAAPGCYYYVQAYYYKVSEGRFILGSGSNRWIPANSWYTPIVNLLDNSFTAVTFHPADTCSNYTVKIAS